MTFISAISLTLDFSRVYVAIARPKLFQRFDLMRFEAVETAILPVAGYHTWLKPGVTDSGISLS